MNNLEKELQVTKNSLYNLTRCITLVFEKKSKIARAEYIRCMFRLYEMANKIKTRIEDENRKD